MGERRVKLTDKDKCFLEQLHRLLEEGEVEIELASPFPTRAVLRRNYGHGIEARFSMTRQGIRWRFQRVMDQYVSGYETIIFIERLLGARMRDIATKISLERWKQWSEAVGGLGTPPDRGE